MTSVDFPGSYLEVIATESARAAEALARANLHARVPACPDWTAADLAYHLAEVQDAWSQMVERAPAGPSDTDPAERPPDGELAAFLRSRTAALVSALGSHGSDEPCWSWSPSGGRVAWVLRRQAHEALIHRVDAEQSAGLTVTEPDTALAADGIDEMVHVMLGGLPPWGTFAPADGRLQLREPGGSSWELTLGRFTGTSPTTGTTYDEDRVVAGAAEPGPTDGTTEIVATAWDLDLWLWGRVGDEAVTVTGDRDVAARLRTIIVDSSA